jgi:hypothetical protein
MMENVTNRIEQVQLALLGLVWKEDIIVGHSLENDMRALRFSHENVVDTAVLFQGDGRKCALRHLTNVLLQRSIQTGNGSGHCSEEDAAAALELAVKRARIGESFELRGRQRMHANTLELIDVVRQHFAGDSSYPVTKDAGPLVCVGPSEWIRSSPLTKSSAHALICEDISSPSRKAITAWLKSEKKRASVAVGTFKIKKLSEIREAENVIVSLVHAFLRLSCICFIAQ